MKKETLSNIFRVAMMSVPFVLYGGWSVVQNEAAVYRAFDSEDGSNVLCDVDPWCRDLTANEIRIAKTSFGDEIDYATVNVFSRLPLSALLFGEDKKGDMYTVYGNLYMATPLLREGELTLSDSVLYQHEMTHVQQFQKYGKEFILAGVQEEEQKERETGVSRYEYDITAVTDFKDYGLEQQAAIIENIQALRLKAHYYNAAGREGICADLKTHEDKAKQMLPIRPSKACMSLAM